MNRPRRGARAGDLRLASTSIWHDISGGLSPWPNAGIGPVTVTLEAEGDRLLGAFPTSLQVWESHNDVLSVLRPVRRKLGHSPTCQVEAMAHPSRPIWGVQFHPEVEHTERGRELFENFLAQCRR